MTYDQVKSLSLKPEEFKRLCGIRPETNNCDARGSAISLTAWLRLPQQRTKQKTGRPGKLSLEDQLLMTLEYWSGAGDAPPPENTVHTFILVNRGE